MTTTYVKQTAKTGFWYSEGTQKSQIPDTSKEANHGDPVHRGTGRRLVRSGSWYTGLVATSRAERM